MQAVRASVKPHAISPETGEVLALDDSIEGWIERDTRGVFLVIAIVVLFMVEGEWQVQ